MFEIFINIIKSILSVMRQSLAFSLLIAVLCMFFYLCAKENGIKGAFVKWYEAFKASRRFRRCLLLSFFVALILNQTLFNRFETIDPLSNVMGDWGVYIDENGKLSTRGIENILLMLPFTFTLFLALSDKIMKKISFFGVIWRSVASSFGFSLFIEVTQLVTRLGTFQLSDLAYNTLGGLIGGVAFYLCYLISSVGKKQKCDKLKT